MKIKKFILVTLLILVACTPYTATLEAGSTKKAATKTPKATSTPGNGSQLGIQEDTLKGLTVNVWHPWFGVESSLFELLVQDFNKENKWGIIVISTSQNNYSYLYENVSKSFATSNRPDLVIALPEQVLAWDAEGVVIDLIPYVDDPYYGVDSSDFYDIFWIQDNFGRRRVAVPAQRTARFMLWNQSWANDLGFASAPKTRADFEQQACRAHQAMLTDASARNDSMGGWLVDTSWQTAFSWLLSFEGGVLEQNDYRFLTPNNIAAFKYLRLLSEKNCAWQVTPDVDPYQAFANREALFASVSLDEFSDQSRAFSDAGNADTWVALPYPGDVQDGVVAYGSSYMILKSGKEQQLATWLFVRWLLDPERDARMVSATHLFPLRASTLNLLADYEKTHPQWAEAVKLIPEMTLQPQLASWRSVKIMIGDGFTQMYRVNLQSGQVAVILAQMESTSRDLSK
jgi:ABC-type glycerol-3-phosphate transport system substrate-binding protein